MNSKLLTQFSNAWKVSNYGVFPGPYFPIFGPNTEIYEVNFRIQSEYGKIRNGKNSVFGHFSHSALKTKRLCISFTVSLKSKSISGVQKQKDYQMVLIAFLMSCMVSFTISTWRNTEVSKFVFCLFLMVLVITLFFFMLSILQKRI